MVLACFARGCERFNRLFWAYPQPTKLRMHGGVGVRHGIVVVLTYIWREAGLTGRANKSSEHRSFLLVYPELLRSFTPTSAGAGEAQQPLPNGAHRRYTDGPEGRPKPLLKCGQWSEQQTSAPLWRCRIRKQGLLSGRVRVATIVEPPDKFEVAPERTSATSCGALLGSAGGTNARAAEALEDLVDVRIIVCKVVQLAAGHLLELYNGEHHELLCGVFIIADLHLARKRAQGGRVQLDGLDGLDGQPIFQHADTCSKVQQRGERGDGGDRVRVASAERLALHLQHLAVQQLSGGEVGEVGVAVAAELLPQQRAEVADGTECFRVPTAE
eukprot:scaffold86790_cov73-Phaeocystis_antarctica.AAC.1